MATSTLARIATLERALGDGGGADCPLCAARPRITGPWSDPEPERCPRCGAPWRRWTFTIRLGGCDPLGATDD